MDNANLSSCTTNEDLDVWHGDNATNISRSDGKAKKLATTKKLELIGTMENLSELAKADPRVHLKDVMAPVRDYFKYIQGKPDAYPISNRPTHPVITQAMPELTTGFVEALSSNTIYSRVATVKVIKVSTKFCNQDLNIIYRQIFVDSSLTHVAV
jgi:hypothetical protein